MQVIIYWLMAVVVSCKFRTTESWDGVPTWAPAHRLHSTDATVTVAWNVPKNTGFTWTTDLTYCPSDLTKVQADANLTNYPISMPKADYKTYLINGDFWGACVTVALSSHDRKYTVTSLTSSTNYKFSITLKGKRAASATDQSVTTSEPLLMTTKIASTRTEPEFVELFARGTGLHNHDNAQVILTYGSTTQTILDSSAYRGLYLAVFNRKTMALANTPKFYDTMLD